MSGGGRSWPAGVHLEQGAQHDMTPAEDGTLPSMRSPDDVLLVTAGGEGAGWSAWLPAWAPFRHAYRATPPRAPGRRAAARLRPGRLLGPMGLIRVLRPDVTPAPPPAIRLAPRRELPEQPVIGLIANGKPLAKELLEILAREIDPPRARSCGCRSPPHRR